MNSPMVYEAPRADLTDSEVEFICRPLTQRAAMVRYLRGLRLHVDVAPDGRPLVNRAHYNAVRAGQVPATAASAQNDAQPAAANLVALQAWAAKRRGPRGKAA